MFSRPLFVGALLLAACSTAPMKPPGAEAVREKLIELQTDPKLSYLAPAALQDAQDAVRTAQTPERDLALADYRVYMADRKVDVAIAEAQARAAENPERRATSATAAAANATEQARGPADPADARRAAAARWTTETRRQIGGLQARVTDRGLVLTLGDILFTSDSADLADGAAGRLDRLVAFLDWYPNGTATIEGHTDDVGAASYNQRLSQRRADAVRAYLTEHGVEGARLHSAGEGAADPVAENDTAAGRRQNRRVEVIISNRSVAAN